MPYLLPLNEIRAGDRDRVGDKAAFLGELLAAGVDVPPGWCLTADAYRAAIAANDVDRRIAARLGATDLDDPVDLEQAADDIRSYIESAVIPTETAELLRQTLEAASGGAWHTSYAVRASRIVQDVVNPRASGLEQAFLGVCGTDAVLAHVAKIWSTPWTSRAIYYRNLKRMDPRTISIAVLIQPMIDAESAGVMFTANPMTLAPGEIHVDATWGLGEAVIAARWAPDHFVIDKAGLVVGERRIANKNVMETVAAEGGMQTVVVGPEMQDRPCLSDAQLVALANTGKRIESLFGAPQDVEWCVGGTKIWVLQTRPLKKG